MSSSAPWTRVLARALGWGTGYWLAGQIGLATELEGTLLPLVAPTAGVAAVWFLTGTRRTWPADAVALVCASVLVSWQLGAPAVQMVAGATSGLLQVAVLVVIMRRASGDLAPFGEGRHAWRVRDLGYFMVAAILAGVVGATVGTLAQAGAGLPAGDLQGFLVRWGRNSSAIVAVGGAGLILSSTLRGRRAVPGGVRLPRATVVEGLAMGAYSIAIYVLSFTVLDGYPIMFLLFTATVWVGTRFSPATIAVHGLVMGTLTVWFTITGHGIFETVDDPATRAVLAQLFVLQTSATALLIGLGRAQLAASERTSEERTQLLNDVLNEVSDGILVVEEDGRVLVFNPAGHAILGVHSPITEARPTAPRTAFLTDGTPMPDDQLPHVRALSGETVLGEEVRLRPPGLPGERIVRVNAHVLPAIDGEPRRALVSFHDVTADRLHRDALASFAGHVAHDLKNPLTVIEGWTEALTDEFEAGPTVDSVVGLSMTKRIESASVRMREFIRELLDHTLARDQSLRPELLDLVVIASDVAASRTGGARGPDSPCIRVDGAGAAWADPVLVRIVLDNLVGNACKYVAPGVRPEVVITLTEDGYDWLDVAIADNGIGIPEDQRQLVFESFHRVEQPGYTGTGLGLSICQRIVERHGGTIAVEGGRDGTGSCFRFTLPRRSDVLRRHAAPATASI